MSECVCECAESVYCDCWYVSACEMRVCVECGCVTCVLACDLLVRWLGRVWVCACVCQCVDV